MVENTPEHYMSLAISQAWRYQLLTYPNPAVGCTVVKNDQVLAVGVHKKAGESHAEVNALKEAFLSAFPSSPLKELNSSHDIHDFLKTNHQGFFNDCEIYVTLEPCNHTGRTPACAMLLKELNPKKVYISVLDPNENARGGVQRLKDAGIEVEAGILQKEGEALLSPFTLWHKDRFVFFKLAMRRDGSVEGGYITSQDSLNMVHKIRTKIDLMVIGGNTVRIDRPTLDTRFAKESKAPDILIYSKQKEFDSDIKLFKVPNRSVKISDTLDIEDKNFVMIEGGYTLLEHLKKSMDMVVVFISHKDMSLELIDIEKKLGAKKIHSHMINETDELVFLIP